MTHHHLAALGAFGVGLLMPSAALACGGFFCSNVPMDQSKERIVFAVDDDEGTIDMHVQIFYQGEADRFAWVVPVPNVPEVGLGSDTFFQYLEAVTRPNFWLEWEMKGECDDGYWGYPGAVDELADGDATAGGAPEDDGVVVEASGVSGPYAYQVVRASSTQALTDWLADPDGDPGTDDAYDVPAGIGGKLGPYLANGNRFIAFKLTADSTAGDILPIRLTFDGTTATIPLILTSIAATPDMRLEPYVFAEHRAVPSNYFHVVINEAKINWLTNGGNYDDVVTLAADEAGGQGFATDYYGPTESFRDVVWSEDRFDTAGLRAITDPREMIDALLWGGLPRTAAVQNLLRAFIPMPPEAVQAGIDERDFYNNAWSYEAYYASIDFDADALVDALEERVLEPLESSNELFHDYPMVTRMTSSVSPEDMTVDPMFVLNRDMTEPVSNEHRATLVIDCTEVSSIVDAPRWIRLSDGTIVNVPPEAWFAENGGGYDAWLDDIDQPAASRIERTGAEGQPEPWQDQSDDVRAGLSTWNAWVNDNFGGGYADAGGEPVRGGCGCTQGSPGSAWPAGLALMGLLGLRRRRR